MIGLTLSLALLLALAVSARRVLWRVRLHRRLRALPGAAKENPIAVRSFREIDDEVARRHCPCGAGLDSCGEGSTRSGSRLLRFVLVECRACERRSRIYFDVSRLYN